MSTRTFRLQPKLQLALLRGRNRRALVARGFTLIELMITVAIVGLLSAVALPQFLGQRTAAAAGAKIGEKIGLAKECATYVASAGIGETPGVTSPDNCTTSGGQYTATWTGSPKGVRCLGVSVDGKQSATITVSASGGLSCAV